MKLNHLTTKHSLTQAPPLPAALLLLWLVPGEALAHVEVGVAPRVPVRVPALHVQPAELVEVGRCKGRAKNMETIYWTCGGVANMINIISVKLNSFFLGSHNFQEVTLPGKSQFQGSSIFWEVTFLGKSLALY